MSRSKARFSAWPGSYSLPRIPLENFYRQAVLSIWLAEGFLQASPDSELQRARVQGEGLSRNAPDYASCQTSHDRPRTLTLHLYSISLGIVLYLLVFYWFYSILKRIEKTLQEIKKLLESKPLNPTQ